MDVKRKVLRMLLLASVGQAAYQMACPSMWAMPGGEEEEQSTSSAVLFQGSTAPGLSPEEQKAQAQIQIQEDLKKQALLFTTSPLLVERVRAADALVATHPEVRDWLCLGFGLKPYHLEDLVQKALPPSEVPPSPTPENPDRSWSLQAMKSSIKKMFKGDRTPLPPNFSIGDETFAWVALPKAAFEHQWGHSQEEPQLFKGLPQDSPATAGLWQAWYQAKLMYWMEGLYERSYLVWGMVQKTLRHIPPHLSMRQELYKALAFETRIFPELQYETAILLDFSMRDQALASFLKRSDLSSGLRLAGIKSISPANPWRVQTLEEFIDRKDVNPRDQVIATIHLPPDHGRRETLLTEALGRPLTKVQMGHKMREDYSSGEARWRVLAAMNLPETSSLRRDSMAKIVSQEGFSILSRAVAAVVSNDRELRAQLAASPDLRYYMNHTALVYRILQSETLEKEQLEEILSVWND